MMSLHTTMTIQDYTSIQHRKILFHGAKKRNTFNKILIKRRTAYESVHISQRWTRNILRAQDKIQVYR